MASPRSDRFPRDGIPKGIFNEEVLVSSCELEPELLSAAGPNPTNSPPPFFHNLIPRSDRIMSRKKHRTASQMHSDFDEILENSPSHFEVPI